MIIANSLRETLDADKPTLGTHFLFADPDIPELIGDTGLFDYGEYCAEYSAFGMESLYHLARAGQCGNLPLMIKLDQANEEFWAQAAVGAGFQAVLYTDVRDSADVARCHAAIRPDMPDHGGRMGVKLRRPLLSGYESQRYLRDVNAVVFAIMVEKNATVENLDEVFSAASAKGVDISQWGPADFGFSRGTPDLLYSDEIKPYEERVIAKSIEYGIAPRIEIGEVEQAKRYIDLGVRHFCIGWDRFIYMQGLQRLGEGMRKLVETI